MTRIKPFATLLLALTASAAFITAGWVLSASLSTHTPEVASPAYGYGADSLVGASEKQIANFAVEYLRETGITNNSTPQVLLTRRVTRADITKLGLGCVAQPLSIEEPPLALVILRGSFKAAGPSPRLKEGKFMAVVFDEWSAQPVRLLTSRAGRGLGKALNNPNLDSQGSEFPTTCPPDEPRHVHYGGVPPTPSVGVIDSQAVPTATVVLPRPETTPGIAIDSP